MMDKPNSELQNATTPNVPKLYLKITYLAILLWLISLVLPAFVSFGNSETMFGWNVLLMGWIGPLAVNLAWFANIFWFVAISKLMGEGKSAIKAAGWAVVFSLNTFTFEFIPNVVNGGNPIYGLGLGAALWLVAIALTFLGASIKEECLTGKLENPSLSKLYLVGLIAIVGGLAIHDRVIGNMDERKKLNGQLVAFKRSQICGITSKPSNQILLNGSLELAPSLNYNQRPLKSYFLENPEIFLELGIPVVRKGGLDYYLEDINDIKSIKSRAASNEVAAILTVIKQIHKHGDHDSTMEPMYRVHLATPKGVIGFNQIVMKQYVREYCPSSIEQLVKQTLIIPQKI